MKICRRSGLLVRHAASSDAKLVTASQAFPDEQARSATVRRVIASGPVPSRVPRRLCANARTLRSTLSPCSTIMRSHHARLFYQRSMQGFERGCRKNNDAASMPQDQAQS